MDRCRPSRAPAPPQGPAHLVEVAELPEQDQQLLMELDLLGRVGQVGLEQGVGEQPGYALEDELEVLGGVWAGIPRATNGNAIHIAIKSISPAAISIILFIMTSLITYS